MNILKMCLLTLIVILTIFTSIQAQTNFEKYSNNWVLNVGVSGSWEDYSVSTSSILYEEGVYKMWYTASDGITLHENIGYATSPDGVQWTKYPANPVFTGTPGEWDYPDTGWPCVIRVNGQYLMWYSGRNGGTLIQIGLATSTDGITWDKYAGNPVLKVSPGQWDSGQINQTSVIYDGSTYKMWYTGWHGNGYQIGYATSQNGIDWQKHGIVLDKGPSGAWDDGLVRFPSVLWDGNRYVMHYDVGRKGDPLNRIMVAFSDDGIVWDKYPDPVLLSGPAETWDSRGVMYPVVLLQDGKYKLWYTGRDADGTTVRIGYAEGPKDIIFTEIGGHFPPLHAGAAKWGDYDNDNDLDLLITGDPTFSSNYITKLYRNDAGFFTEISTGMQAVGSSSVDWGDYDNDGDLDILLIGVFKPSSSFITVSKIYRNDGSSGPTSWIFTDIGAALSPSASGGAGWADFDNDGDLDVYITGVFNFSFGPRIGKVYLNNGNDIFTDSGASIGAVSSGSTDAGDFDNDGDIDILINGLDENEAKLTKIYRNNGSAMFTELDVGLNQVHDGQLAWGDYDDDGDLDILQSGQLPSMTTTQIYRNDGALGTSWLFTPISTTMDNLRGGYAEWGDFDNDGDLDILITGSRNFHLDLRTKIYRNDGSAGLTAWNFTDAGAPLTDVANGLGTIGDYDNDGDLDIFLMGVTSSSGHVSKLYRNDCPISNSPPSSPFGLGATIGSSALLSWNMPSDDTTPSQALAYNLRVGTSPGGIDVIAPMSDLNTGRRRIVGRGSADLNTSWELKDLSPGTSYYWSVQAIDHGFAGSPFAPEGTFSLNRPPNCIGAAIAEQSAGAGCSATISGANVTGVTDPDGDALTITVSPTTLVLGANTVTVTVDDGNGGTCSTTITVNVVDNTAPVADVASLPNATGECSVTLTAPTATDNCAGTINATTTDPTTYTTQGAFSITWTYDDGNGNNSTQSQNVIVADVTPPVITADLIPVAGEDDDDEHSEDDEGEHHDDNDRFAVQCSATDNCDPSPAISSVMQTPAMSNPTVEFKIKNEQMLVFDINKNEVKVEGPDPQGLWAAVQNAGGVAVINGQVLKLKVTGGHKHEFKFDKAGNLQEVKGPQASTLVCIATDAAGNVSAETVSAALPTDDNDDDEDKAHKASVNILSSGNLPSEFALAQNHPNPFNPTTTITFAVPEAGEVTLTIYNLRGQLIQTLYSGSIGAGQHNAVWNGTDFRGRRVASGIYLYKLEANGFVATRKLVFTK